MLTPHTHVTPINITGIAEANAQDQAEADQLLGTARGIIREMEQVGQENLTMRRQRELDRAWDATGYAELGIGFDREGRWHGREEEDDPTPQYSTPLQDALFIGGCIAFIAAMVAAIWAVVHYAPDTIHP